MWIMCQNIKNKSVETLTNQNIYDWFDISSHRHTRVFFCRICAYVCSVTIIMY